MKKSTDTTPPHAPAAPERARYGLLITAGAFLFIAVVYAGTFFALYPAMPITERIAESIPGFAAHYPPFRTDENTYMAITRAILDGRLYEAGAPEWSFPLGYPLVAAPFVALFGDRGGFVANILIMLGCLAVLYGILRTYAGRGGAIALTLAGAFATTAWFYADSCYSEPLAQLCILGSCALAMRRGTPSSAFWRLAVAGAIGALVLFSRPHAVVAVAPFFAYLAITRGKKPALAFALGGGLTVLVWCVRNALVFGGPLTFEYSRLAASFVPGAHTTFLKGNLLLGIHRLLFDQYHGLFTITPILLLFPAGLHAMGTRGYRAEAWTLAASVGLVAFVAAAGPYPFTEFGLGSRHLVPVLFLMIVPLAFLMNRGAFNRSLLVVCAVYSFYHAGIGWFTGQEPGHNFFLGILNESQSRAIILARKDALPRPDFSSRDELIAAFHRAIRRADLYRLLQTLDAQTIRTVAGNERNLLLSLRQTPTPDAFIRAADPATGISLSLDIQDGSP